jgi:hypothetical protein
MGTIAEFWSPLFEQTQVTFVMFYCYLFIENIVSFFNDIEISAILVYF